MGLRDPALDVHSPLGLWNSTDLWPSLCPKELNMLEWDHGPQWVHQVAVLLLPSRGRACSVRKRPPEGKAGISRATMLPVA